MQRIRTALLVAGAICLAACAVDASTSGSGAPDTVSIVGSFEVKYSVSVGSGVTGFEVRDATELRFGPDFVVIREADGGGLALPVARVHELTWEEK